MKARKYTKETIRDLGIPSRNFPSFSVGDTIVVAQRIEGEKEERIQLFEGDVIAKNNNGVSSTFIVRRLSANGVYVERTFPLYTPMIESIKIVRKGVVRRAKLYYLRNRIGRATRIEERILTKEQKENAANKNA